MLNRITIATLCFTSLTALAQEYEFGDGEYQAPPNQPGPNVTAVDEFVRPLSPYGSWVFDHGARVFQPAPQLVGSDFTPYATQGQWVATSAGWEFQSSLPFSWATYHYGRWYQSPRYGWVWVPDTQWGPSWVQWRYGGGYAGWAPLPPRFVVTGYETRWFFVESSHLCHPNVHRYGVGPSRAWGVTASLAGRGAWPAGPSYRDWHSQYGHEHRAPPVQVAPPRPRWSVRSAPPPPPTFSRTPPFAPRYVPHPAAPYGRGGAKPGASRAHGRHHP